MAIGDIWRVDGRVRTFNDTTPGAEKYFEWVTVYHYRNDTGNEPDMFGGLTLQSHVLTILTPPFKIFSGNTRLVHTRAVNLTSSFVVEQDLSISMGDSEKCLPPQVALGVYGRGAALGRRAMKFYSSLSLVNLAANGELNTTAPSSAMKDLAFSPAFGFMGDVYTAIIFGEAETPKDVTITRVFSSPQFRTQRRRVLTMT